MKDREFVIYIQGAATGVVQGGDTERGIREDDALAEARIAALCGSGCRPLEGAGTNAVLYAGKSHTVLRIGNARDGFSLAQLYAEIQRFPLATTFIIDAHGNEDGEGPNGESLNTVSCGPAVKNADGEDDDDANLHTAGEILEAITNSTQGQPVNVFFLTCGSRLAALESDKMALGSTLVTFTSLDEWQNSSPPVKGFRVPYIRARNFAEQLCLNMQASMVDFAYENILSIAVVRADLSPDSRDYNMWDQAMTGGFTEPHYDMPDDFVRMMREDCLAYMGEATFNALIETLQLQTRHQHSTTEVAGLRTPVKLLISSRMDPTVFRREVAAHGLMGPLGVYAYLLGERFEPLGAFQTMPPETYTTPRPERPARVGDQTGLFAKLGLDLREQGALEALVARLATDRDGPG